jgi:hypothetical protein
MPSIHQTFVPPSPQRDLKARPVAKRCGSQSWPLIRKRNQEVLRSSQHHSTDSATENSWCFCKCWPQLTELHENFQHWASRRATATTFLAPTHRWRSLSPKSSVKSGRGDFSIKCTLINTRLQKNHEKSRKLYY